MTYEIEIQLPDVSLGEITDFAEHFGCRATKTKHKDYYIISTEEVINIYWLGCNMNNNLLNQLSKAAGVGSSLAKYIEL